MKKLLLIAMITGLASCKDTKKTENISATDVNEQISVTASEHPGKKLMESKCYLCHNPKASENNVIAPPMAAIKARYSKEYNNTEEFANAIWAFIEKPTKEKAKLKGAVKKFGVMPYQQFSESDIKSISQFMFEYQIDEPVWFKKHWEKEHGQSDYMQKGKQLNTNEGGVQTHKEKGAKYALSTKQILGKNLMGTIQKKGTLAALEFCNVQALPLTDSMATVHHAKIKRVSDKPRNPKNTASTKELKHITYFKNALSSGEDYEPIIETNDDGTVQFYAPIVTNTMCLQCHGTTQNIKPEVLKSLANLYPNDLATGYNENEVRGIWSIYFEE